LKVYSILLVCLKQASGPCLITKMNYTATHPLNLIGKVAVVTSASTPLGAAIIRALLNSNAFVLGLSTSPPHQTTSFTVASHFQFLCIGLEEENVGEKVLEVVRKRFGRDEVDFVVCVDVNDEECDEAVGDEKDVVEELKNLSIVLDGMARRGEGTVIGVVGNGGDGDVIPVAKSAASRFKKCGVRWNIVISHEVYSDPNHRFILDSETRSSLRVHIDEHEFKRQQGGYAVDVDREAANLALFLCTDLGREVNGGMLGVNGICVSL